MSSASGLCQLSILFKKRKMDITQDRSPDRSLLGMAAQGGEEPDSPLVSAKGGIEGMRDAASLA